MRTTLPLFAFVAVAGCAPSKQKRCERYAKEGLALIMGIANGASRGLGADGDHEIALSAEDHAKASRAAVAECMTWPDDFVRCITDGDFESAACREAYAAKEGVVVQAEGASGPAPTARTIGKYDILQCRGARCVIEGEEGVQALDGTALAPGDFVGFIQRDGVDVPLTTNEGELTLAGATPTRFAAPRPAPDDSLAVPLTATPKGLVLFDDGRVRRLQPPPCESCFEDTPWRFEGYHSSLDMPELFEVPDGLLYYGDRSRLVVLANDGSLRFALHARDELGQPLVVGDDLFIGAGKEALALDLGKCKSEAPLTPAELIGPCVKARFAVPDAIYARPERLGTAVYYLADGRVHQLVDGHKGWAAEVEAESMVAVERDASRALLVAVHWTMDHPGRLLALDPDSGKTLMQVDIEIGHFASVDLHRAEDRVVVLSGDRLFTWELGALQAALAL